LPLFTADTIIFFLSLSSSFHYADYATLFITPLFRLYAMPPFLSMPLFATLLRHYAATPMATPPHTLRAIIDDIVDATP